MTITHQQLLDAGVHFGHIKRKWNPNMAPYIFMERNGVHIIDLNKTIAKIDEAARGLKQIAKSGKRILFIATKKQAKSYIAEQSKKINMPYVTERWQGGMLTNFATIRKTIKKISAIDKMATNGTFDNISKKERLMVTRQKDKLEMQLGSIVDLTRLPAALFIVDISKEHIAVSEARKLNIPTFAIVDTNSDPRTVDFAIPANDDSAQSIKVIVDYIVGEIEVGLSERQTERVIEDKTEETTEKSERRIDDEANEAEKALRRKNAKAGMDADLKSKELRKRRSKGDDFSDNKKGGGGADKRPRGRR